MAQLEVKACCEVYVIFESRYCENEHIATDVLRSVSYKQLVVIAPQTSSIAK
jgi:hypothetical protein